MCERGDLSASVLQSLFSLSPLKATLRKKKGGKSRRHVQPVRHRLSSPLFSSSYFCEDLVCWSFSLWRICMIDDVISLCLSVVAWIHVDCLRLLSSPFDAVQTRHRVKCSLETGRGGWTHRQLPARRSVECGATECVCCVWMSVMGSGTSA